MTSHYAGALKQAGFLQIIDGMVRVEGKMLSSGGGLQFDGTEVCKITADADSEVLLFDLA